MTTVKDILQYIEHLAPRHMKAQWDNVGLLCGSESQPVKKILVALDPFEHVCHEAAEIGADLLVTHHPLIFVAPNAITDDTSVGRSVIALIRNNISAINAHTNLDCAPGGVNDVLAAKLGLTDTEVLLYEGSDFGLLRAGTVKTQSLTDFAATVKSALCCQGLRLVDAGRPVSKVAVGGGACGDGVREVYDAGCDTFITADVKYNQFWDAKELGINLIDAGHFHTENPIVAVLAEKLRVAFPEITVEVSKSHCDCINFF